MQSELAPVASPGVTVPLAHFVPPAVTGALVVIGSDDKCLYVLAAVSKDVI
ncbi:hypothetical protein [Thermomicrobium sp.]